MLELLDGKIAVERGSLSMTMAQDDNHRKELETCRNDLTNCLEASSQMQRWANDLILSILNFNENLSELE